MSIVEGEPVEVWVEEDHDFGAADESRSNRGIAWSVEGDSKGDVEVGHVERTDRPTRDGTAAAVTLVIALNEERFRPGTIVARGALPYEDGDVRDGYLAIVSGTGGHAGKQGVIEVTSRNPKKYREM
jgi:hypothetical protein